MSDSIRESTYVKNCKNAKKHRTLYHYTSFEVLLKIVSEKRMRLSTLVMLNDPIEYDRLSCDPFIQNKVYVCCFNHILRDTIPLWKMYADGPYGVRIGFPQKSLSFFRNITNYEFEFSDNIISPDDNNPRREWKVRDVSLIDVTYDDNLLNYTHNIDIYHNSELPMKKEVDAIGFLKRKCWDFEKETRVRVGLQPHGDLGVWLNNTTAEFKYATPPYKYIYCGMPDGVLSSMKIMFSPMSNDILIDMMKNEIRRLIRDYNDENFQRSDIIIK